MTASPALARIERAQDAGLPEDWDIVRLGELYSERKEAGVAGLPVMSVTLNGGLILRDSLERRVESALDPDQHALAKEGDLVYNTMRMWQGASGIASKDCMVSPAYVVAAPNGRILPAFARHLFKAPSVIASLFSYSHGITGDRLRLYYQNFEEVPVALPPVAEQRTIGAILSSLDDAIAATGRVMEQARRVKRGLQQTLLTRGIGHTWFQRTEIGKIPEGWKLCNLTEVLTGIEAGKSPVASSDPARDGRWGVLKVSAIGDGRFRPDENKTLPEGYSVEAIHQVKPGDVLISRANTAKLVGAACQVPSADYRLMLSDKTLRLKPNLKRIRPGFLAELVNAPTSRSYFAAVASGSSASMKNLSQAKIGSLKIALPPLAEQQSIEPVLATARETLEAEEAQIAGLETLQRALLQGLLTGRVRVSLD